MTFPGVRIKNITNKKQMKDNTVINIACATMIQPLFRFLLLFMIEKGKLELTCYQLVNFHYLIRLFNI